LVVWETRRSGPELWDIQGRFINRAGALSAPFTISQTPSPSFNPVTVAFDGTNYLVAWNRDLGLGFPNPTIWDIYGRLVLPSGSFVRQEFTITNTPGNQVFPFIAFDGTNYLMTWTETSNDANGNFVCDNGEGTCTDIYGRFISPSGTLVGSAFPITTDAGNQLGSAVVFGGGKYLVVWNSVVDLSGGRFTGGDVFGAFIVPAKAP